MSDLSLPPRMDLAAAAGMLERLREIAKSEEDCRLIGSEVVSIGTACVQSLIAFDQLLLEKGRRIALVDPSPALLDGMRQLGLEDLTARWMEMR